MNTQEIYTKIRHHLLTQNRRATINQTCCYRTPEGLMCAVGCLFPSNFDISQILNDSVNAQIVQYALHELGIFNEYPLNETDTAKLNLLRRMQCIHDQHQPYEWERLLNDAASYFNLKIEG